MTEDVLVKLTEGLLWLKLYSTRTGHIGLAIEEEVSEVLHLEHRFIWC